MSANDTQHGGDHYKTEYEHWDWAIDMNMGPLEYAATKYVSRWWKKGGEIDLKKPAHYIEKIIEAHGNARPYPKAKDRLWSNGSGGILRSFEMTRDWAWANNLTEPETLVCWLLASWSTVEELRAAQRILEDLAADPQRAAGGRAGRGQGGTGPGQAPATAGRHGGAGGQPCGPGAASASERSAFTAITGKVQADNLSKDGMKHPFGYQGEG